MYACFIFIVLVSEWSMIEFLCYLSICVLFKQINIIITVPLNMHKLHKCTLNRNQKVIKQINKRKANHHWQLTHCSPQHKINWNKYLRTKNYPPYLVSLQKFVSRIYFRYKRSFSDFEQSQFAWVKITIFRLY